MLEAPFASDVGRSDRICRADSWAALSDLKAIATVGNVGLLWAQSDVVLYIVVVSVSQSSIRPLGAVSTCASIVRPQHTHMLRVPSSDTPLCEWSLPALYSSTDEIELTVVKCVTNDQRFSMRMFAMFIVNLILTSLPGKIVAHFFNPIFM